MRKYRYAAVAQDKKRVRGVIESRSAAQARNELVSRHLRLIEIKERRALRQIEITRKRLKPVDIMNLSRQLSAFLRAGVPILEALEAIASEVKDPLMRDVLVDIAEALRGGTSLSDAVATHADLFPPYYVSILQSAELTGNLDVVLQQLSIYIERDLEAKRALKSALTYPAVIFVMAVITVIVLVGYVLPRFESFFKSFKAKLPLPTRLLLNFSHFIGQWWWLMTGLTAIAGLGLYVFLRSERGRLARDRTLLRIPIIGDVVRFAVVERFCRILGSMIRAGVPVPDGMAAATGATNNGVYRVALTNARMAMLRGEGLSRPIAETQLFPVAAAQMVRVGEESGTLDEQLGIAADFYASELAYKLKRVTSLFEPAVIVIMGLIVGFVAIALVSAMYGIFNQVKL